MRPGCDRVTAISIKNLSGMISMFKNLEFPSIKVLIVLSSLVSAPLAMGDISGEWNFSLNVQGQSGSAVATIRQNDEEIEGTYVGQRFGTVDFVGTIVDGELDFQLNLDLGPIIYEGRLQDDGSIKGTADLAGMALANFVATKSD